MGEEQKNDASVLTNLSTSSSTTKNEGSNQSRSCAASNVQQPKPTNKRKRSELGFDSEETTENPSKKPRCDPASHDNPLNLVESLKKEEMVVMKCMEEMKEKEEEEEVKTMKEKIKRSEKQISDLNTKLAEGLFGYDELTGMSRPPIDDSIFDEWKKIIAGYLSKDLPIKVPVAATSFSLPPWAIQEYKYTYNYIGNTISYIPLPEETNESEQVPCKCFDMVISLVWDLLHHIKDKKIEIKVIADQ